MADDETAQQNQVFPRLVGEVAQLGGWSVELPAQKLIWSDQARAIYELPPGASPTVEEMLEFRPPDDRAVARGYLLACATEGTPFDFESEVRTARGNQRWVRSAAEAVRDARGKVIRIQGILQDITGPRLAAEKVARQSRVQASMSQLQSAMARIRDQQELYDAACRIAVEAGGLHAAWIGLVDEATSQVRAVARAGQIDGYPEEIRISVGAKAKGGGPFGKAISSGQPMVCADTENDPAFAPWRASALARGFRSVAVFPFSLGGRVIGGFALYAGVKDFFDVHEVGLLSRLAADISYAVELIDREQGRQRAEAALRISEERFRAIFEQAAVGLCLVSPDYRFVRVNQQFCQMLGYSADELLADGYCVDTTHPEDRAGDAAAVARLLAGESSVTLEKRYLHKQGHAVWARLTLSVLRSQLGMPEQFLGIAADITARKKAEEERDRLFNLTDDLLFVGNFDGRLEQVNPAFTHALGWSAAELTSQPWIHFVHPDDHEATVRAREALAKNQPVRDFENRFRCTDGSWRWLSWRVIPLMESRQVFGVARDVTERKRIEDTLREQATLLDKAQDAIVVCDLEHRILYWNASAERLYGWKAAEVMSRSAEHLFHPGSEAFRAAVAATLSKGEWVGELEQLDRQRKLLVVECHWTLVRDQEGKPKSILAINTDITERRKLEAHFFRAQRLESIGTLAGGIAHDINNVLAPILMSILMLQEGETDPARRDDLRTIETCARRGADMVRQLLSFARGAGGQRTRVDLRKIAAEVQNIVRDTFPKDITFRLKASALRCEVDADPTQMHQLLTNLCLNARDAMPRGGTLTVSVDPVVLDEIYAGMNFQAKPGPYVRIEVEDTGAGMPPEMLDRIFEPFFTTKETGKGTGLGLSTAHAIVRGQRGFVHVYSEPGKGSRFQIHLPAGLPPEARVEAAVEPSALPRGNGELILVVDDEESIRAMARRTLETFGYRVLGAANGAEAVSHYAQHRAEIAVVLTDMNMPVMDGAATIVALRAIDPAVRVVGSSGLADSHVVQAGGAGPYAFVPKPYTAGTLLVALRKILTDVP